MYAVIEMSSPKVTICTDASAVSKVTGISVRSILKVDSETYWIPEKTKYVITNNVEIIKSKRGRKKK